MHSPFKCSTSVHAGRLKNTLPEIQLLPEVKWENTGKQMEKEIKQEEKEKSVGGVEEKRAESTCIGRGGGRRV